MASFHVHEDGTRLQKLTDGQVAARLAAYNPDGGFERDLQALWREAGEAIEATLLAQGGEDAARQLHSRFAMKVDAAWIQAVADYGIELYLRKLSVPIVIDRRARLTAAMCETLRDHYMEDPGLPK